MRVRLRVVFLDTSALHAVEEYLSCQSCFGRFWYKSFAKPITRLVMILMKTHCSMYDKPITQESLVGRVSRKTGV